MMRAILSLFAVVCLGFSTLAYDFIGSPPVRWPAGDIEVVIQMDDTRTPKLLQDGKLSWDSVALESFNLWNETVSRVQFVPTSATGNADGNDRNEIFFSDRIYGQRFGDGVLAVTTVWRIGTTRVEGDTIFNDSIDWDSYRGDLDHDEIDLRRVAIHEFGHILGLDHPDEAGQQIPAVMNSHISDLDTLVEDDARGAYALYAALGQYFTVNAQIEPPEAGYIIVNPFLPNGSYPAGTELTLVPKPYKGFRFNFWSGIDPLPMTRGKTLKVRIYEDMDLVANFTSNSAPRITLHPRTQVVSSGSMVSFRVKASGAGTTFQWQHNGVDIPGATNAILTLINVGHSDAGLYSAIARNVRGVSSSKPARLIVDGY